MAGVASDGADHAMTCNAHGVGGETGRRIGVARTALNPGNRNVWWGRVAGGVRSIVAAQAVGVACLVNIEGARKGREGRRRSGMARDTILPIDGDMPRIRRR